MDFNGAKRNNFCAGVYLLILCFSHGVHAYNTYMFTDQNESHLDPEIVTLTQERIKRDTAGATVAAANPVAPVPAPPTDHATVTSIVPALNVSQANQDNAATAASPTSSVVAAVTQTPLLGVNGSGIRRDVNNPSVTKVSDPIIPDDNITAEVFKENPEKIQAEHNMTSLKYDNHDFYNSSFIGNQTYFDEYWANITKTRAENHAVLSNSHRRATTLRLRFEFPFYGHPLRNITVATGGFIYTGEHVHNWLAATQYIAPLMANFDTTLTNDSFVKMYDDGEKFTAFWENVTLQEDVSKKFTFAVTLYKNGDIVFAYKTIPIAVDKINDSEHPVKVGISDAYLTDRILFLRRKTIYEYHRVSFKNYEISNGTILRLTAMPTCLQYTSCSSCVNHETGFDCMWCEKIQKCSSGTDRNKQDWLLRNCDKEQIGNETQCPATVDRGNNADGTSYRTDSAGPFHQSVVNTIPENPSTVPNGQPSIADVPRTSPVQGARTDAYAPTSTGGWVTAIIVLMSLVATLAAWAFYAYKNPETPSGQLLIKYRPSQWSWRRGEARYTAATIHM